MSVIQRLQSAQAPITAPITEPTPAPAPKSGGFIEGVKKFYGFGPKEVKSNKAEAVQKTAPVKTGVVARLQQPAPTTPEPETVSKPSVVTRLKGNSAKPSQYFGGMNADESTFGPAPEFDTSGKPFLEYKNKGDVASTTDKTRVATSFDPRLASPQTRESFYNPRSVENKAELRAAMGGAWDDELDHKIAVALSGSNDPKNLRPEPADQNTDSAKIVELQKKVIDGKMSLFDAQVELAKYKGIEIPWTGTPKKLPTYAGFLSTLKDAWVNKVAPAIDKITERPAEGSKEAATTKGNFISSLIETILPGVKAIRDNPELTGTLKPADLVKEVPGAVGQVAQSLVHQAASYPLTFYGATSKLLSQDKSGMKNAPGVNDDGEFRATVPLLGTFTNLQARIADEAKEKAPPKGAWLGLDVAKHTGEEFLNGLFVASIASSVVNPRVVAVTKTGNVKVPKGAVENTAPRSGRLYEPTVYKQPVSPEVFSKITTENKIPVKAAYDTKNPIFFEYTGVGDTAATGRFVQVKPSFLNRFMNVFKGDVAKAPKGMLVPVTGPIESSPSIIPPVVKAPTIESASGSATPIKEASQTPQAPISATPAINVTPTSILNKTSVTEVPNRYQAIPEEFRTTATTDKQPHEILDTHSKALEAQTVVNEAKVDSDLKHHKDPARLPEVYAQNIKNINFALDRATDPSEKAYWRSQLRLANHKLDYLNEKISNEGNKVEEPSGDKAPKLADHEEYTPASRRTADIFAESKNQKDIQVGNESYQLGDFGRKSFERKGDVKGDRFPESELQNTLKHTKKVSRASNDPTSYRYDNVVHIAKMPDGETRVVYTRLNKAGKEEIINWHKISNPKYEKDLLLNGVPERARTSNLPVRTGGLYPLSYGNKDIVTGKKTEVKKLSTSKALASDFDIEKAKQDLETKIERQQEIKEEFEAGDLSPSRQLKLETEIGKLTADIKKLQRSIKDIRNLAQVGVVERAQYDRSIPNELDTENAEIKKMLDNIFSGSEKVEINFKDRLPKGYEGSFTRKPDILTGEFKNKIDLLTKDGKSSKDTAMHEAFHGAFNLFLTSKQRGSMIRTVKIAFPITKPGRYTQYETSDKRAEEFLADDFADWDNYQKGTSPKYEGKFARIWRKFKAYLRNLRRRILGFEKIYKDFVNGEKPDMNVKELQNEIEVSREMKLSDDDMKHISEIIEQGATRAEAKAEVEQKVIRTQNEAQRSKIVEETLPQLIRNSLNPLKGVDEETADIFRKWDTREKMGEEMSREEKKQAVESLEAADVPDNFDTINKYEANKEQFPAVKRIFDSLYADAAHLDDTEIGYIENYIPHVYSNNATQFNQIAMKYLEGKGLTEKEAEDYLAGKTTLPEAQAKRLGLMPFFVKERMFESYAEAIKYGLTPKYRKISDLAAYYRGKLQRAIANRGLIDTLEERGKILPDVQAPSSWTPLNPQFSASTTYKAPGAVAGLINDIFPNISGQGFAIRTLGKTLGATAKGSKFLQDVVLSAGLPYSNFNFFANGQLIKELTAGNFKAIGPYLRSNSDYFSKKFFEEKAPIIQKMARQGIDLSRRLGGWGEKTFNEMIQDKEWSRAFGHGFGKAFNEKTFKSFMPQLQIQIFEGAYNTALKKGLSDNEAVKFAGTVTKNNFGLFTDEFARSKLVKDFLSTVFFAPPYREGIIRIINNAARASYDFAKNPAKANPAYRKSLYLIAGVAITYMIYNIINKKLNGNYMWDNPDGREMALRIPRENGDVAYIELMPGTASFPRAMITGGLALARGDLKTATQRFGSLLSQPIHLITDVLGNEDYYGRPIYKDNDPAPVKAKKIGLYIGLNANHPYVREIVNQTTDKNPLYQSVSAALELPFKFSTLDKEALARIYAEADKKDKQFQADKIKFEPKYEEIRAMVKNGNEEGAVEALQALSPEQQRMYKSLKAEEVSADNAKANKAVAAKFEDIQKLIGDGHAQEAEVLFNQLTPDEQKAYQRLKNKTK